MATEQLSIATAISLHIEMDLVIARQGSNKGIPGLCLLDFLILIKPRATHGN